MAKGNNQKLKALHLLDILREQSDEEHPLTLNQLMSALEHRGVEIRDRKSLYSDIEALRLYGADIVGQHRGREYVYYLGEREFELPELKLLADAVQSSRFITQSKTMKLLGKLQRLTSAHQGHQLQQQAHVLNRSKATGEQIYYNVDALHSAIAQGKQISFQYCEWSLTWGREKVEKLPRRGGERYRVSPIVLIWEDENYYLRAFDHLRNEARSYRGDKMQQIRLEDASVQVPEADRIDPALYTKATFNMFSGKAETVKLEFSNRLIGVVVDRYGKDVFLSPGVDAHHFFATVQVALSPQFYSWVFSFGGEARIAEPAWVAEDFRNQLKAVLEGYAE
jgi:predicted DNA-binding transcriptional regulator YafY